MKILSIIFVVTMISAGCKITRTQTYESPYLASACADKFPPKVKTTVNTVILPGDNTAQKNAVDSAVRAGQGIVNNLKRDSAYAADSISRKCADLVGSYINQIRALQAKIGDTKPCVPDTIRHDSIIDRTDVAALLACEQQGDTKDMDIKARDEDIAHFKKTIYVGIPIAFIGGFLICLIWFKKRS
jgi:ribosomal protein S11